MAIFGAYVVAILEHTFLPVSSVLFDPLGVLFFSVRGIRMVEKVGSKAANLYTPKGSKSVL